MPDEGEPERIEHAIPIRKPIPYRYGQKRVALCCRVGTKMERQPNSLSGQMDFQKEDIINHSSISVPTAGPAATSIPVLGSQLPIQDAP